jgi:hypothetical protein
MKKLHVVYNMELMGIYEIYFKRFLFVNAWRKKSVIFCV